MRNLFKDKKVLIFGLGILGGGLGAAKFFLKQKANIIITDKKSKEELKDSLDKLKGYKITYVLGEHREEDFKQADLIIKNPDIPSDSPYLKIATENNVPVESEASLFIKLYPYPENLIGVTGTRGKTTTTMMIAHILKTAGFSTLVGGNVKSLASLPLLYKAKEKTKIVLELSSWQLQSFSRSKLSPHIAVITNIYEDHLNRYKSIIDYIQDKKQIFKHQTKSDFLITNSENIFTKEFAFETKSQVKLFNSKTLPQSWALKVPGEHNRENAAAALLVARLQKIKDSVSKKALENFSGVEFRIQTIRTLNGVKYINDSTSTTPISGYCGLLSFQEPITLICGGNSKNLETKQFIRAIIEHTKTVILIKGNATHDLKKGIEEQAARDNRLSPIKGEIYNDLVKAVKKAKDLAKKGDVVLFSPGFTSFGMFKNEFDRGEQFNQIVKSLK